MTNSTTVNNSNGAFDVFNDIAVSIAMPYVKMFECSRVFLSDAIIVNGKRIKILEPDMRVCIENGELANGNETHIIKRLSGTLANTKFEILVMDLNTFEMSTINL